MQPAPRLLPALLLAAAALLSPSGCSRDEGAKGSSGKLTFAIEAIKACPEGATVEGEPPPAGDRQRCQKSETTRHGASREWYSNGRERAYSEWWEGEKHGRFRLWFEDGQLRAEGAHRFGFPAGHWRYFGKDGKLMQDRTFDLAAPAEDWIAQALAGKPPVRDVPERTGGAASEMTGAGAIESPLADGLPPLKDEAKPAPKAAPPAVDPVFPRGTQGAN